jgi:hypothetical protein
MDGLRALELVSDYGGRIYPVLIIELRDDCPGPSMQASLELAHLSDSAGTSPLIRWRGMGAPEEKEE